MYIIFFNDCTCPDRYIIKLLRGEKMTKNIKLFLDYLNNFLTVSAFADYYGFSIKKANKIIKTGRKEHNKLIEG
jgi:hypothetical protein